MDGFRRSTQSLPRPPRKNKQSQNSELDALVPEPVERAASTPTSTPSISDEIELDSGPSLKPLGKHRKRGWLIVLFLLVAFVAVSVGAYVWYLQQLKPVDASSDSKQQFVVDEGTSFADVTARLDDRGLIRSSLAFDILARLNSQASAIKAGTCSLTPALSAAEILDKLTSGCQDFRSITFYPGATIEKPFYKSPSATLSQTLYVKNVLRQAGYDNQQISQALNASYDTPLFAGKPPETTLEGYIYGETYFVDTDATAESVLQTTFDEMYKVIEQYGLVEAYKQQGLDNLYQGITMASIVQRELNCEDKPTKERKDRCYGYQRKIAQVLLKRLREGIPLGADVTFIYAADMAQQQPTINFDSPYNTRINKGLPPGPIGTPGELALRATADPSDTEYLYFVAGDDGLIYFSKTQAEHDKNTRDHCQKLCFELE